MLSEYQRDEFIKRFFDVAFAAHRTAKEKGFWPEDKVRLAEQKICLMHSELSELLEAIRKPNADHQMIEDFSQEEIELADLIIRAMDYAVGRELRLPRAILAKMDFNEGRPHMHGKRF